MQLYLAFNPLQILMGEELLLPLARHSCLHHAGERAPPHACPTGVLVAGVCVIAELREGLHPVANAAACVLLPAKAGFPALGCLLQPDSGRTHLVGVCASAKRRLSFPWITRAGSGELAVDVGLLWSLPRGSSDGSWGWSETLRWAGDGTFGML